MAGVFGGDDDSLFLGLENNLTDAEMIMRTRQNAPLADDILPNPAPGPGRIGGTPIAATDAEFELAPGDPDSIEEDQGASRGEPALLSVFPTSTTNPLRPRTLAAGYDHSTKTMTVMFRDGTLYNYYEISTSLWNGFKRAFSKGVWIRQNLDVRGGGLGEAVGNQSGANAVNTNKVRTYAALMQTGRKGTQFKTTSEFGKPGAAPKPVKLSGYQNQVRRLMRQGHTAEAAITEARRKINSDFYRK